MVVSNVTQIDSGKPVLTQSQTISGFGSGKLQPASQLAPIRSGTGGQEAASTGLNKEQLQEELQKAIEETNSALEFKNIALAYSVDQTTEEIVVKVIDKSADKLIRQIPPESVLKFRGRMKELLGVIFDENG